jgi:P-type conjugative transfer protein TrbJ
MKKLALAISITLIVNTTYAGTVAGFGGATEYTAILSNVQLVTSYAKQAEQYVMQGLQYEAQLKHLMSNPASLLGGEAEALVKGIGSLMAAGESMGGSLAAIDKKFASTFNSPTAASFSTNFSNWTNTSKDTLKNAMSAAGMHRDQYSSNASALQALYTQSQNTGGDLSALQTLAKINIKQVQQTQALGDLMATQNIASSTWMAAQTSKEQAVQDTHDKLWKFEKLPPAVMRPQNKDNF